MLNETVLTALVLLPFVGRAFESQLTDVLLRTRRAITPCEMMGDHMAYNWGGCVRELGWSNPAALVIGALRLVLWHWLQPAMYVVALFAYGSELGSAQLTLGQVVAFREATYPLLTLLALRLAPGFLLCTLSRQPGSGEGDPERGGRRFASVLMYVASPEKYVGFCVWHTHGGDLDCRRVEGVLWTAFLWAMFALTFVLLPAADLCGVAALLLGAVQGTLPLPLAVGWAVTAVGALSSFLSLMVLCCHEGAAVCVAACCTPPFFCLACWCGRYEDLKDMEDDFQGDFRQCLLEDAAVPAPESVAGGHDDVDTQPAAVAVAVAEQPTTAGAAAAARPGGGEQGWSELGGGSSSSTSNSSSDDDNDNCRRP